MRTWQLGSNFSFAMFSSLHAINFMKLKLYLLEADFDKNLDA